MQENSCKITLKASFFYDIILFDNLFSEKGGGKDDKSREKTI